MHVAGRNNRNAVAVADFQHLAVIIAQILVILCRIAVAANHEFIVCDRLNLEIIIESCELIEFILGFALDDGGEQLSGFTCAAVEQSLVMLDQQ